MRVLSLLLFASSLANAATWQHAPIGVKVDGPAWFKACVSAACAEWAKHGNVDFSSENADICVKLDRDGSEFENRFQFGVSAISIDANQHIRHVDIAINGRAYAWRRHVLSTILHELGHALGLDHTDGEMDVMNAINHMWKLSEADVNSLQALYPSKEE